MASFRCYDNSDVIATIYAQTWQVLTLKKCIEPFFTCQYGLCCCIGPRFCSTVLETFEQLAKIFWANGLPPPLAKNSPYAYDHESGWYGASKLHISVDLLCGITAAELHNSVDLLCGITDAEPNNLVWCMHQESHSFFKEKYEGLIQSKIILRV